MGAGLKRLVEKLLEAKVDWKSLLRQAFRFGYGRTVVSTYRRPSRKHSAFPGLRRFTIPTVHFGIDTSGSMSENEIIDRVAKVLEEQNTLERVDLTSEKIQDSPEWEREIAEEALQQSRSLRHRLETIETIEELKQAAADTTAYYRKLNREWWKRRFANLGSDKAGLIADKVSELSPEDKERVKERATEIIESA